MSLQAIVPITVNPDDYKDGIYDILKLVRPSWQPDSIFFQVFTEGITNQLVGCHKDEQEMVLVRIYGKNTELLIDRKIEYLSMELLHSIGMAPQIYCCFTNGMCYGYQPGRPIDVDEVYQPKISSLIIQEMVRLHAVKASHVQHLPDCNIFFKGEPVLFKKIKSMLQLLPSKFEDSQKQERYISEVLTKMNLWEEFTSFCEVFDNCDVPLRICHNDLLLKNIIYNEETDSTSFIDFEYTGENYIAYDIANHFCEYAGVEEVDFSRCPNEAYQLKWIKNYLELSKKLASPEGSESQTVTEHEIRHMYVWVNKFFVVSHFFWGIWALVQAHNSSIDFDFLGYGILRLGEYLRCKDLLQVELPSSNTPS